MFRRTVVAFWADDRGSVLAAEYLTLGTVVALGSATGLSSIRDSINNECAEFGDSVRQVRRDYAPVPRAARTATAPRAAAAYELAPTYDQPAPVTFRAPPAETP